MIATTHDRNALRGLLVFLLEPAHLSRSRIDHNRGWTTGGGVESALLRLDKDRLLRLDLLDLLGLLDKDRLLWLDLLDLLGLLDKDRLLLLLLLLLHCLKLLELFELLGLG